MGHILTNEGVAPDPSKVNAIQVMPKPDDRNGVHRYLAMCQYLSKFCPRLSEAVFPLRDLIKMNVEFMWTDVHEESFNSAKDLIVSGCILQYYDLTLPVVLQIDALEEASGGVLLQDEGMSGHCDMSEQMASVSVWKERYSCSYISSATRNNIQKPLSKAPRRLQRMMLKLQQHDFPFNTRKEKRCSLYSVHFVSSAS